MQVVTDNFVHGSAPIYDHTETEGILGTDGLRISQVTFVKRYLYEAIRGVGEVQLQYRYSSNGEIGFVGYEMFSGGIGDRKGSLILDITGTVNSKNGVISANQILRPGSGSSEFMGYSGKGSYVIAKNGYCSFEFTLNA